MADPVGTQAFPLMIGGVAVICSLVMVLKPDPDPDWPMGRIWISPARAVVVVVLYAYALKPIGFLLLPPGS